MRNVISVWIEQSVSSLSKGKVFEREATGLVREISAYRAFVLNLMFTSPAFMLIFLVIGQGLFPGAYLPVSALLALIPSLLVAYMYAQFSAAFPRSGGDYVFVGRILHPSIGFMLNFVATIINISVIGVEAVWISTMALGPMLNALSGINGDPGLATLATSLTTTSSQFIIGAIFAVILPVVLFFGTGITFKLKGLFFVITTFSVLVYLVAMGTTPVAQFISNFNSLSTTPYNTVISTAQGAGANLSINASDTMLGVVYTLLAVWGFTASVYTGGEVKNPQRSQVIAMLGAPVVYIVLMFFVALVTYSSIGHDFLASIAYLALNANPAYTLPTGLPILQFLAGYGTKNAAVEWIMGIGLLATLFGYMLAASFTSVRCLFAWSFDAVIPRKFSEVNERYHVPYIATLTVIIIDLLFVFLTVYTSVAAFFTYVVTGSFVSVAIVGLAGVLFPRVRGDVFNLSPPLTTRKIAGVPIIVIVGAISIPMGLAIAYASMLPALVGPLNPQYITVVAALFVIGLVLYFVSYAIQKSRGIPVDKMHRMIPPE